MTTTTIRNYGSRQDMILYRTGQGIGVGVEIGGIYYAIVSRSGDNAQGLAIAAQQPGDWQRVSYMPQSSNYLRVMGVVA